MVGYCFIETWVKQFFVSRLLPLAARVRPLRRARLGRERRVQPPDQQRQPRGRGRVRVPGEWWWWWWWWWWPWWCCQVGPNGTNKPIRASAKLNVLLPPTAAELVGHGAGAELQVREQEEVELKCVIHNARPRPDIIWYLGGEEFVRGEYVNKYFLRLSKYFWNFPKILKVYSPGASAAVRLLVWAWSISIMFTVNIAP